jgi:hypothetical protein
MIFLSLIRRLCDIYQLVYLVINLRNFTRYLFYDLQRVFLSKYVTIIFYTDSRDYLEHQLPCVEQPAILLKVKKPRPMDVVIT